MVATTADWMNIQRLNAELVADESVNVSVVDRIAEGNDYFGFNYGNGKTEVLSPSVMRRFMPEGVDEGDAFLYTLKHETRVHNPRRLGGLGISDKDPEAHAAGDVQSIRELIAQGYYGAARAGIELHKHRVKKASGNDRKFSEYALEMLGTDGDSAYGEFSRRYGGGLANGEGKKGGLISRLYRSIWESIYEQYKPLDKPLGNAWDYAVSRTWQAVWDIASTPFSEDSFIGKFPRGIAKGFKSKADVSLQNISPLIRTMTIGFGPGRTNIERIYAYVDGSGKKWPIYMTTYDKPIPPNAEKLDEEIKYVLANADSSLKRITPDLAARTMNPIFMQRHLRNYLGKEFHDEFFEEEMDIIRSWLFREDTKYAGLWLPDAQAEAQLPAGYAGKVKVFRKNVGTGGPLYWLGEKIYGDKRPKSFDMFKACAAGDFGQDIAGAIYGAPLAAALKFAKASEEGIRTAMLDSFKFGSKIASRDHPFTYDLN